MIIYVLDKNFKKIGFPIDEYISCIWHTSFFEIGDCELYLNAKKEVLNLLKSGTYLVRDQDMTLRYYTNVMSIKSIKTENDIENGNHIIVTGKDLKEILTRRVILDSNVSPGFFGNVLSKVFEENFTNPKNQKRKISNLDFFCNIQKTSYLYIYSNDINKNNAGEWIMEQCKNNECGIIPEVVIKGSRAGYIDFTVVQSEITENVIFSSEYGNLLNSSYVFDKTNYRNVAVVSNDEATVIVNDSIAGLDRIEMCVESSTSKDNYNSSDVIDVEGTFKEALKYEGNQALKDAATEELFECTVDTHNQFILDKDIFLGNKVPVIDDYNNMATSIITDIIDTHDETGRTIIPQFSTFEITK